MYELLTSFLGLLNSEELPDIELDTTLVEELNELEKQSGPKSSQKQTDNLSNRVKSFLRDENLSDDLLNITTKILNDYLRYFYSKARTKDDKFYTPSSLVCFRAAIHRDFNIHWPTINIISNEEFSQSNCMLKIKVEKYKTSGQTQRAEDFP